MTIDLFILLLVGFIFLAGLIAVEAGDLLSAVIAIGVAGSGLCVVDLLLGAPDLAFPQVVLEVVTLVLLIRMIMMRRDTSRQTARDTLRTGAALLVGGILLVTAFISLGGAGGKPGTTIPKFGESVLARATPVPATQPASAPAASGATADVRILETGNANASLASPPPGVTDAQAAQPGATTQPVSVAYLTQTQKDTGSDNYVMGILLGYRAYDALGGATIIFVAILGGFVVLRKVGRKREGEEDEKP